LFAELLGSKSVLIAAASAVDELFTRIGFGMITEAGYKSGTLDETIAINTSGQSTDS